MINVKINYIIYNVFLNIIRINLMEIIYNVLIVDKNNILIICKHFIIKILKNIILNNKLIRLNNLIKYKNIN
jgi:hypothetical protein